MDLFNKNFDRVAQLLPFSYGVLDDSIMNNKNKTKMKKRNLRNSIKNGYIWDSYKPLDYKEWREANGYSVAECKAKGIKINDLFPQYQKYKNKCFLDHSEVNSKYADIQTFNLICNLLDKGEYEPPKKSVEEKVEYTDWVIGCI